MMHFAEPLHRIDETRRTFLFVQTAEAFAEHQRTCEACDGTRSRAKHVPLKLCPTGENLRQLFIRQGGRRDGR